MTRSTVAVALALTAVTSAACGGKSAAPAGPSNTAEAPMAGAVLDDELAYLPLDSDVVIGFDAVAMRQSALWQKFEPQIIAAFGSKLPAIREKCGFDPMITLERGAIGGKVTNEKFSGVGVIKGVIGDKGLQCWASANEGEVAKVEGGVLTIDKDGEKFVARIIGGNTMVMQFGATVSAASLDAAIASGAPLRGSKAFLDLFGRREQGASMWGMVNGNSELLANAAQMGARPKSIDGTLVLKDKFFINGRVTFANAADADNVGKQLAPVKGMASGRVEQFDIATNGALLTASVVATDEQLRQILGMLGMGM